MADKQRAWRHYQVHHFDACTVAGGGDERLLRCEMGIVETGRSRVFAGYFFRVALEDDEQITGEDGASMIAALRSLAHDLSARGLRLQCAGISAQWRESGLSRNTGWGYYGHQQQPIHMLAEMPDDDAGEALDRAIREAVEGMRIGLA